MANTELILFSDDDIHWLPWAFEVMRRQLEAHPEASYSYGAYVIDGRTNSGHAFDGADLRWKNFVNTMALVRREHHPGWDENLNRLQDWDVYLTMLEQGYTGLYCGKVVFETAKRDGITYGGKVSYEQAERAVRMKHGLFNEITAKA